MTTKEYLELTKAALKLEEIREDLKRIQFENEKLKEELTNEKEKNIKEAKKKANMRIEATKKWLNGYPQE
jgi:regulator of replication initiation timing